MAQPGSRCRNLRKGCVIDPYVAPYKLRMRHFWPSCGTFTPGVVLIVSPPPEDLLETPDSPAATADVDGVFGLEPEIGAEFHQHLVSTLDRHDGGAGARADLHLGGVAAGEAAGRDFQHLELRIDRHRLLAEELLSQDLPGNLAD